MGIARPLPPATTPPRSASPYFNGNAVRVRFVAAPKAPAPSLRIHALNVGRGDWVQPASICGSTDDRTIGNKLASARLLVRVDTST